MQFLSLKDHNPFWGSISFTPYSICSWGQQNTCPVTRNSSFHGCTTNCRRMTQAASCPNESPKKTWFIQIHSRISIAFIIPSNQGTISRKKTHVFSSRPVPLHDQNSLLPARFSNWIISHLYGSMGRVRYIYLLIYHNIQPFMWANIPYTYSMGMLLGSLRPINRCTKGTYKVITITSSRTP